MASKLINSQYLVDTTGSVEVQGADPKPVTSLAPGDVIIFQNQIILISTIVESDEVRSSDTTVPTSWTGTSAGKLVELDGSARIPAVDGSLVTNVIHTEVDPTGLKIASNLSDLNNAATARTNIKAVRSFSVQVVADGTSVTTTDVYYICVSSALNGLSLASFKVFTPTASVGSFPQHTTYTIQKKSGVSWVDMLTGTVSVIAGATTGTGTIDAEPSSVATDDILKISVPVQGVTTPPQGLVVYGTFN